MFLLSVYALWVNVVIEALRSLSHASILFHDLIGFVVNLRPEGAVGHVPLLVIVLL